MGTSVELPCKLSQLNDDIIQIEWEKKRNGTENKIYTILGNGKTVPENINGLKGRLKFLGNATTGVGTILLEDARTTDEADYVCRFILFESKPVEKVILLQVQGKNLHVFFM